MEMLGRIRRMYVRDKLSLHEITKSTDKLSGVVTSTVGRRVFCALRSALLVSPDLAPTDHSENAPTARTASSGV